MPLPAGTGLDRRRFLSRSLGLALAVYGAGRLPLAAFEEGIAEAAATVRNQPVLVSVFLDGGADSLSILFPNGDPDYRRLRPTLALPESSGRPFAEDGRLLWHPAAAPLETLHTEGKLTVLPAIGYTDPDQSHFTSRHFWEVGATSARLRTGWLGRFLDRDGTAHNPLQGLSFSPRLQPALATARVPVAALEGPDSYSFPAPGVSGEVHSRMLETLGKLGAKRHSDAALRQAAAVAAQADLLRRQLSPFTQGAPFTPPATYPRSRDAFPRRLAGIAAMLSFGFPLRCVALTAPGAYDTHANQPDALTAGLQVTAASLLAFQRDLEARGLGDRVVTLVWSGFGRRARENGSSGTDHGAAGIGFLMGTRVRGRMIGEFPPLAGGLDERGNLRPTSDFRAVYCALLEQWLRGEAEPVIPGARSFAQPSLLR